MKRLIVLSVGVIVALLGAGGLQAQTFVLFGYQNMTGPGDAHLLLHIDSVPENWSNATLRIHISGPTSGTLIFAKVSEETDLGYFSLDAGNYTFDFYILEEFGATVEESGTPLAHGQATFSIPQPPRPPEEMKPLIDPVDLGFMITALLIFSFILTISRTTKHPKGEEPENDDT